MNESGDAAVRVPVMFDDLLAVYRRRDSEMREELALSEALNARLHRELQEMGERVRALDEIVRENNTTLVTDAAFGVVEAAREAIPVESLDVS